MAKLVILTEGLTGRVHELKAERTTIGRVEDNMFQISEPSVSSHHCEIHLRGGEVVVKDLNSTNGTFIGGEKIIESVLKPGQTLRLGNVELRLENGAPPAAAAPTSVSAQKPAGSPATMPRGVRLDQLEQGGRAPGFDSSSIFTKKSNKVNRVFLIAGVLVSLVIIVLLIFVFKFAAPAH
jgi:pSer/pThr/pTyr-binding forkhead associated (FHA) protein